MSYARFLLIDGIAAGISVPIFILIGYKFAEHIEKVWIWIDHIKHILLPVAAVIIVGAVAIYIVRRKRRPVIENG